MTEDPSALWTAAESAAADRHTMDDLGIPSLLLMERAALCVAHEVAARLAPGQRVIALCGPGNNGGDGVAMARILRGWGVDAEVRLCAPRHNEVVAEQLRLARALSVPIHEGLPASAVEDDAVLVDALLGTGAAGAPRGAIEAAIRWFNAGAGPRVAIDLPTGVDADTGALPGIAAVSQLTVTMQRSKPGLHITPGRGCAGAVVIADIGLRAAPITASAPSTRLIEPRVIQALIAGLRAGAHKGERGHVGVIGGSVGTAGAAILTATAALRCGAGLCTLAARDPATLTPFLALRPELMIGRRSDQGAPLPGASVLAVGPGLTAAEDRRGLAELWRDDPRPAVWDASALAEIPLGGPPPAGPRILTPHPGEAARILASAGAAISSSQVQADRVAAIRGLVAATQAIVVLKGEGTLVAEGDRLAIAVSGGPGLATAGSGDCLTGFIAALLARGLAPWDAACAGVHLHGIAGELAVAERPGAVALEIADLAGAAMIASPEHPRWPRVRAG